MIISLGVTLSGEIDCLGGHKSSTENARVCRDFLISLKERRLKTEEKILFVIDGSKGLRKGIETVFEKQAIVQRCQWHKRENVVSCLPKNKQSRFRKKLQKAYEEKDYGQAVNNTQRVNYWKNSDQRQRWLATALLEIEPGLRKIKGFKFLPFLRANMKGFKQHDYQSNIA